MSDLAEALRDMATYDWGFEEQSDTVFAAADTIDRLTAEVEAEKALVIECRDTISGLRHEGVELNRQVAELTAENAELTGLYNAALQTATANAQLLDGAQRRERAAVKDLSIDSHCTLCKHHRSEGGDCYGVSKCAIKGIKTQWQWRGPEAGKGEAE